MLSSAASATTRPTATNEPFTAQTTNSHKIQSSNYQPKYSVTLKPANGGKVLVNAALAGKPEYRDILFGKLTKRQERAMHYRMLNHWSICWATIALNYFGHFPLWLTCLMVAYCCINQGVVGHANLHLRTKLPMHLRMLGYGLWCGGYMPFAGTYGDLLQEHIKEHHSTKGPLDRSERDIDSIWSDLPMWKMLLCFFLYPSHSSGWDIVFHQYTNHAMSLWPERIAVNIFHWAQLYLLYQTGVFWTVLFTGHCSMFGLWTGFHGLIHRPDFYKFLIESDPSGARKVHPILESIGRLISEHAWIEMKWHDVHHSHGLAVMCPGPQNLMGVTVDEIEAACADMADEGLFLDSNGKPVSPLAEVGHEVGSRKRYLLEMEKIKALPESGGNSRL